MTPTVGRIVLFMESNAHAAPAIVTRTWNNDHTVSLTVFPDGFAPYTQKGVELDQEQSKPGTWSWPRREK